MRRFVSWQSDQPGWMLKRGGGEAYISEAQKKAIADAYAIMPRLPLEVTDSLHDIADIEAEIRNEAMRGKVAGVLVDYAQLVSGGRGDTQEQKLANVAERLQRLANEVETCIMLPSQVTVQQDGRVTEKGATALKHNCTLALHIVRGGPKDKDHERLLSPTVNIMCEATRDDEPFGKIECTGHFACYRLEGPKDDHPKPNLQAHAQPSDRYPDGLGNPDEEYNGE
jgi:hypothetical protein